MLFTNFEGISTFPVPSIILAETPVYLHEFKRSWFVIRDWWISIRFVCFVFQGSLLCDRPVSGNNRLVSLACVSSETHNLQRVLRPRGYSLIKAIWVFAAPEGIVCSRFGVKYGISFDYFGLI